MIRVSRDRDQPGTSERVGRDTPCPLTRLSLQPADRHPELPRLRDRALWYGTVRRPMYVEWRSLAEDSPQAVDKRHADGHRYQGHHARLALTQLHCGHLQKRDAAVEENDHRKERSDPPAARENGH